MFCLALVLEPFNPRNQIDFWDLVADTDERHFAMACVCDEIGKIGWINSSELIVESVDGQDVVSALN